MNKKLKAGIKRFFSVLSICVLAASIPTLYFLYSMHSKKCNDLRREIARLEKEQEKLIEDNKRLVADISELAKPERIEQIAIEELGMHKAESEDVVRVEMSGEKSRE
jgi:cell division protein FtsL